MRSESVPVFIVLTMVIVGIAAMPAAHAFSWNEDYEMRYLISIDNDTVGVMRLLKEGDELETELYGVTQDDRLPFYSDDKNVQVDSEEPIRLRYLEQDGEQEISFHYDLSDKDEAFLQRAGLYNEDEIAQSSIIVDEIRSSPIYNYTSHKPTTDTEALILSHLTGEKFQEFMYYIPIADRLYRLKHEEGDNTTVRTHLGECPVNKSVYRRAGGDQGELLHFKIYNDRFPVKVNAGSGRWSLELLGIGTEGEKRIDFEDQIVEAAEDKVDAQTTGVATHLAGVDKRPGGEYRVTYSGERYISNPSKDSSEFASYVRSLLEGGRAADMDSGGDGIAVEISHHEACEALKPRIQQWEYNDDCTERIQRMERTYRAHQVRELLESVGGYQQCEADTYSAAFVCDGQERGQDAVAEAINETVDGNVVQVDIRSFGPEQGPPRTTARIERREEVGSGQIQQGAVFALVDRYNADQGDLSPGDLEMRAGETLKDATYVFSSSYESINQHTCESYAERRLGASQIDYQHSGNLCAFDFSVTSGLSADDLVENVHDKYPDIDIVGSGEPQVDGTEVSFRAIRSKLDGGADGCL
ncbi:hypothetical protein HH1059_25190 [Halorhodospira halochloris]|uniref:Uncharacterized protein n=1 Tax=Halorhodospira halochloris TaxID=1052 RepID=A0A0X8X6V4_HALHR|nr:hypothetical protein [Halorhodospira halochloris]MBK1650901.1 hypothetical protein [Halorhodospira halochloris]BAU56596.1 hypothetical protein HH1059_25190 [Halorhodospira halochloris]